MKKIDQNSSAARFLLGGIGTGSISIDQNARLCDFELWNKPNKGFNGFYNFFAVRTEDPDGNVRAKALESQIPPPFPQGHGYHIWEMGSISRFRSSEMTGKYPFVCYKLTDHTMPVEAGLEAFTPFIPLSVDDSSLPAVIMRYSIKNITDKPLTVSVAGSMGNLATVQGTQPNWEKPIYSGECVNRYVDTGIVRGVHFLPVDKTEDKPDYFEMALLTSEDQDVSYLEYWGDGTWWDEIRDFWNDFMEDGSLSPGRQTDAILCTSSQTTIPAASVCVKKKIAPGEEAVFPFVISWYHPNREKSWEGDVPCACDSGCCEPESNRNYYAKFGNSLLSAGYLIENLERLEGESRKFVKALYCSTLPDYVIEAVSANITVIRSTTCFMVEDGTFFGWEGCHDKNGCCWGNCTHVWNYTQTMAFLFPSLERSMRRTEFLYETDDEGNMDFRAREYLGHEHPMQLPAADGQLGTIIRLYRDWKICGDDDFLKEMWPKAKLALDYGCKYWDADNDGVLSGRQHNTYDIEFYGVSSMLNSIFYAALRAGEEICNYLGDASAAKTYASLRERGAKKLDELTYNGEYYIQKIDDVNEYKYQYGTGCLADQVFGQQLAHVSGLGYILPAEHIKTTVSSIYKYNFARDLSDINMLQRTYALNKDAGLLLCSWPKGNQPANPFTYSFEVWTGIEYQVASHLIYEGYVDEGLAIIKAVRERYDGIKRSPWNEVECGHHYARSMASYAVLLALTGFHCDAVNKTLIFKPAINEENFTGFFCCADGWGLYRQEKAADGTVNSRIETLYGDLSDYTIT